MDAKKHKKERVMGPYDLETPQSSRQCPKPNHKRISAVQNTYNLLIFAVLEQVKKEMEIDRPKGTKKKLNTNVNFLQSESELWVYNFSAYLSFRRFIFSGLARFFDDAQRSRADGNATKCKCGEGLIGPPKIRRNRERECTGEKLSR